MLYNSIYSLEQDKKRNVWTDLFQSDLIIRIQSVGDFIREKIIVAKTMVYDLVDQAFV